MRALESLSRDYEIVSSLAETAQSRIFLGRRRSNGQEVVVKTLRAGWTKPEDIFRLRREYGLLMGLSMEGVIKIYDLREMDGVPALVLERFEGITLQKYMERYPHGLPLKLFFPIALHVVSTLAEVHKKGVLHLDLKPSNILVSQKRVCITDFGISQLMGQTTGTLLEGSLPYLSPEQTGRTSFTVDHRSDLYSLGVVFYEILAGRRPFEATDMAGWVHAHLAQKPKSLSEVSSCPSVLSAMVMKLLEKDPEKRYQNAAGLLFDLHTAYKEYQKSGTISDFPLAKRDFSPRLQFSKKLYGRKKTKEFIDEIFRRSLMGGMQHAILIGEKGVGKTLLLETIENNYQDRDMWRLRVVFSQERQTTPYHGLRQFLYDVTQQFYTLPTSEQKALQEGWEKISDQGKVLSIIFPDMEKVFPSRGDIEVIDPDAAQQRLFYFFVEFLRLLVSKKRSLWLVLDHIQWADYESRSLFFYLARQNLPYVGIVTVFQGTTEEWHQFCVGFDIPHRVIEMERWVEEDIRNYLCDLFREESSRIAELAKILFEKTKGNPLSFEMLFRELINEEMIFLDGYQGWKWREKEIVSYHLSRGEKDIQILLADLSENDRQILSLVSCIGNRFTLEMIRNILGVSEEEILSLLQFLIDRGLVEIQSGMVVWTHSLTREKVYTALAEEEKSAAHCRLGKYFLQQEIDSLEDKIYFVLDHVLKGISCLDSQEDGEKVLFLVKQVVEQNKLSGAFAASYETLSQVESLVRQDSQWFLPFYTLYAEAAYYTAHLDTLKTVLEKLKQAGYDEKECFDLWVLLMKALGTQERYEEATSLFFFLASLLSLSFPRKISVLSVLPLLLKVKGKLLKLSEKRLREMPVSQDAFVKKQVKLLFSFTPIAFFSSPFLNVYVNLLGADLSLKNGLFAETPFFFISTGIVVAGLGDKKKGNLIADKGLHLMEKMGYTTNAPQNYFIYYSFLYFWVHPQHEIPERLGRVYELGVSRGEVEYAAYALMVMSLHHWQVGSSLVLTKEYIRQNVFTIHGLGQKSQEIVTRLCLQMVDNLVLLSEDPTTLEGEWYSEREFRPIHEREKEYFILRYLVLYKLILSYLFGKYELAYAVGKSTVEYDPGARSTPAYFLYVLFMGLTASKLAITAHGAHKRQFLNWLRKAEHQYRSWSKLCSQNYAPAWYLLRAELVSLLGSPWKAITLYGKAIEAARTSGYRLYEALAFERRGDFWESQKESLLAEQDRLQAFRLYKRWGSEAKVKQLGSLYPVLYKRMLSRDETTTTHHTLTATATQTVDLVTMIKASEALMAETDVNALLLRILNMVVENAGAEKGVFLYAKEDVLMVRAVKNPDQDGMVVSLPFDEYMDIPQRVIQYALQKDEEILVEDAQEETLFVRDPYIATHMVRSLLIIPVYRVGRRIGLVYLENNMGPGMFTSERIGPLRILLVQASIALQNLDLLNRVKDTTRLETEMNLARNLQVGLLPKKPFLSGYEVRGFMKTADEVGGDYYDVIGETSPGWVMIGDVSGHGFSSGQVMAMTQTALQVLVREDPKRSPVEILRLANQAIMYNIQNIFEDDFKYVTITVFQMWEDGRVYYAGQHQDIWVFREKTREVESLPTDGIWLGIEALQGRTEQVSNLTLEKGDVMFLYTDGLTEARLGGEMLGERVTEVLREWGTEDLATIQEKILERVSEYEVRDDLTFVLIRKT